MDGRVLFGERRGILERAELVERRWQLAGGKRLSNLGEPGGKGEPARFASGGLLSLGGAPGFLGQARFLGPSRLFRSAGDIRLDRGHLVTDDGMVRAELPEPGEGGLDLAGVEPLARIENARLHPFGQGGGLPVVVDVLDAIEEGERTGMLDVTDQHLFARRDGALEIVGRDEFFGLGEKRRNLLRSSFDDGVPISRPDTHGRLETKRGVLDIDRGHGITGKWPKRTGLRSNPPLDAPAARCGRGPIPRRPARLVTRCAGPFPAGEQRPAVYRQAYPGYTKSFAQVSTMYAIVQAGGRQHKATPGGYVTLDG
ncbi:MAG: hypothetical protein AB7O32_11070, partial [Vicinamibacterales bacterium]